MGGFGRGPGGGAMAGGFAAGHGGRFGGRSFGPAGPRFAGGLPAHRPGRHGFRHFRGGFVGPGFYDDYYDFDDYGYGCPYLYGPRYPNQYPWFAGCT